MRRHSNREGIAIDESQLDSHRPRHAYIAELDFTNLSQRTDDLSAYLVCDIELGKGHVRRAEQGILGDPHGAGWLMSRNSGQDLEKRRRLLAAQPRDSTTLKTGCENY